MIWRNGELRLADGAVSAEDRGLLLAEAVFETLLVRHGIPQAWPAHLARLMAACDAFGIAAPNGFDRQHNRDETRSGEQMNQKSAKFHQYQTCPSRARAKSLSAIMVTNCSKFTFGCQSNCCRALVASPTSGSGSLGR